MSLSAIARALRTAVAERDQGRCRYRQLRQVGQGAVFHVDHIVPKTTGGPTALHNLALQCPHCSLHKSSKVDAFDPDSNATVPLFHPLQQDWSSHFRQEPDASLVGITPVGRATILALRMNDPSVKTARAMQRMLGLT